MAVRAILSDTLAAAKPVAASRALVPSHSWLWWTLSPEAAQPRLW